MDTAHRQDDKVCFLSQNLLSCMLLIFYHTVEHYWQTSLEINPARDEAVFGWQWRQLGHMQVCTSLQTDNHASTPPLSFFTGRMPFLPPNQQRQSTEGITVSKH